MWIPIRSTYFFLKEEVLSNTKEVKLFIIRKFGGIYMHRENINPLESTQKQIISACDALGLEPAVFELLAIQGFGSVGSFTVKNVQVNIQFAK